MNMYICITHITHFTIGALEYRSQLLNSKFCLIPKGHQWSARHLWNSIAGGCFFFKICQTTHSYVT